MSDLAMHRRRLRPLTGDGALAQRKRASLTLRSASFRRDEQDEERASVGRDIGSQSRGIREKCLPVDETIRSIHEKSFPHGSDKLSNGGTTSGRLGAALHDDQSTA